jgi:hypothetical protein
MSTAPRIVSAAVEGIVDRTVLRRLLQDAGAALGPIYVANGKARLRTHLKGYNHAAVHTPWIVLVDLDLDAGCAPALRTVWLPSPNRLMSFRVAVRAVEAWLLADRRNMADFLGVPVAKVPSSPEALEHPKRAIIDLARRSRSRDLREDLLPRPTSGRSEGPAYASRMMEFAQSHWRPSAAEALSDSLRRCRQAIELVVGGGDASQTHRKRR